jgi:outer membrane immunogenic protein
MMKRLLGSAALAMMLAAPAMAADMAVKAPLYKAPPPPPVLSWTGFYLGANAGYGWGRTSNTADPGDPATAFFLGGGVFTPEQFATSVRQSGVIAGAQAGYNWQLSPNWVGGIEADLQYAHVKGSPVTTLLLAPGFPWTNEVERSLQWFGTVRGRLGFLATPNLLLYGTAGLAYGETKASGTISNVSAGGILVIAVPPAAFVCIGPAACYAGSSTRTSVGWTAGVGGEYKITGNWSAKLEYLHVELPGQTVTLASPPPSTPTCS